MSAIQEKYFHDLDKYMSKVGEICPRIHPMHRDTTGTAWPTWRHRARGEGRANCRETRHHRRNRTPRGISRPQHTTVGTDWDVLPHKAPTAKSLISHPLLLGLGGLCRRPLGNLIQRLGYLVRGSERGVARSGKQSIQGFLGQARGHGYSLQIRRASKPSNEGGEIEHGHILRLKSLKDGYKFDFSAGRVWQK